MSESKQKQKLETLTTPPGIARFPRLNKPETEVNGKTLDKPRFKVGLVLTDSDPGVAEFKEHVEKLHAEAVAVADKARKADPKRKNKPLVVNPPFRTVLDENGDEIAGQFEIVAKTLAEGKDGTIKLVKMFDAKGRPTKANVGGGSRLKLSVSPGPYDSNLGAGLSLYLNAVQILDLQAYTGGGAKSFGFGVEEGYEAPEDASADTGSPTSDDEATDADEDAGAPRTRGDF